jgi:predicted DNA binding CopG/RHH family protein
MPTKDTSLDATGEQETDMARPTKSEHEKRDKRFNLRFTEAEIEHLRAQAATCGMPPHEYARQRILGHVVKPAKSQIEASVVSELNRIGVNVNQLARAVHTDRSFQQHWQSICNQLQVTLSKVLLSYDP